MQLPLAYSIGDPAGVGPELAAAAWAVRAEHGLPPFFVVGSARLVEQAARRRGLAVPVCTVKAPDEVADCYDGALPVLDLGGHPYTPGEPDDAGAGLALNALATATGLVRSGAACALVTGPVAKSRLARVGFNHPGQTEFVAEACGITPENAVMMLAGPNLRVVPVTVHVPLRDVPGLLSIELIRNRAAITAAGLVRDYGITNPRLAVAGLNPHAGEDGRMGTEDAEIVGPAVAALREVGIDATGPLPPDTMFHAEARARYDVAICMYHDQALIPLKVLDFDTGVNVTLGLPIVRTSPDHGTAFGIAGTGTARVGPTIAALRMAGECAARRALL
ncbi:MAG: 4-hydroxythreonine-4-phosphate dehydrogenase PdxA [Novosphingobium sp. 28-62-57]|uniref:4-hydroxythreonine-4-phosphate dehydrogenase PdxA n=1 Tax=unclassified Novosphingobium TaxID=2644732 RepID=UPI000BDC015D|nr:MULTISPECIES: 4-hydroxythreonine-4-phosphate dehydrogenase PdxA [unclassified Novosphingobium]OYW47833.1 MAG: 4-hydroxythreonine-4-phosphate dehydrogenase PdxA [Novosphingobium sp. 12-63-9]OYZ10726.1 MAG: 4-hydroxythreonine-4-phosphate dehydrogenase PdxA [Novosphingobium sp. 28-62-57]OZA40418.1 MAG: 4-hydroxythreonine-4-phosphate dehydrogenase PdxA [Novosphingobium sp. 17-62-9]HQS68487.1 4-hydroxythreonine-4-phosphate dehydrogenase PdxA [Novosphingobium sp.]